MTTQQQHRMVDGLAILHELSQLIGSDIRIGQALAIVLQEGEDLFLIENDVLLQRLRELNEEAYV